MSAQSSSREPVEKLAEEFAERFRRGERPSLTEYVERYPELAEQIRELFPALVVIEQFGSVAEAAAGPLDRSRVASGKIPEQLGEYHILREVGRGGMGVVYEAVQESLGRHVALKVLPYYALLNPTRLERFRREARAAAQLHHTNIVPVFGIGEHEGIHYYAMQFIQGQGLDAVLKEVKRLRDRKDIPGADAREPRQELTITIAEGLVTGQFAGLNAKAATVAFSASPVLSPPAGRGEGALSSSPSLSLSPHSEMATQSQKQYFRSVARLGVQVAEALAYAHKQGILHRDIKPSNLLLDTQGTVWISDFGLAKAEGSDELTCPGDILGTLRYMAPERFQGKADSRSDVYSLGMALYELLTLRPAFEDLNRARLMDRVTHEEPPRPRKLDLHIPRDLETVILKAIAKEPAGRYQTADEMAEDLRRFLGDRPIRARRSSAAERTWRWCRRNPRVASLLGAVAWLLLAGTLVSTYFAIRAKHEADTNVRHIQDQELLNQRRLYVAVMNLAHQAWQDGRIGLAQQKLQEYKPHDADVLDLRGFEWYYLQRLCRLDLLTLRSHTAWVRSVAFSPNGRWLASGSHDRTVRIWDTVSGKETLTLQGHADKVTSVAFSPDGRQLASASQDSTVKVWEAATGREILTLRGHALPVMGVAFSPDGRRLASASQDGTVKVWDPVSGQEILTLRGHALPVMGVAFSPDGRRLASASWDGTVKLWVATTGKAFRSFRGHTAVVNSVAFNPKGSRLVTASEDQTIRLWETETGKNILALFRHTGPVSAVIFSPDGRWLASASQDRTVRVCDATTGQETLTLRGHGDSATSVVFSPDGRRLASASEDGTVKIWDTTTGHEALTLSEHTAPVERIAFSPDGRWLASGSDDQTVKLWHAATGQEIRTLRGHTHRVACVAFGPDGTRLASAGSDQTVKLWDLLTGEEILTLRGHKGTVWCVAFSPDGRQLASASDDHTVRVWDTSTARATLTLGGHGGVVSGVAFSPDGRRLASASDDQTVKVWEVATGQEILTLEGHTAAVLRVAFSPDGRRLASASDDQTIKIWDAATAREILTLHGHTAPVSGLAFSPDGQRLASASFDRTVKLWDTSLGQEILTLRGHTAYVMSVAFSPDGWRLASASDDHTVKIWDATPLTSERLVQREVRSVVQFLLAKPLSKDELLARIGDDATISKGVRQEALAQAQPAWRSRVQKEAQGLVGSLFFEPLLRPDVLESIRRNGSLSEPVRQEALKLAQHYPEGAGRFNDVSWTLARQPGRAAADYRLALRQAEVACRLVPENATYLTTLGVAQYRVGQCRQAVGTLTQARKLIPVAHQGSLPTAWTFQAMAHWQLGEKKKAWQWYDRAVQWMDKNDPKSEELRRFRAEAEELLGITDDQTHHQDTKDTKKKP